MRWYFNHSCGPIFESPICSPVHRSSIQQTVAPSANIIAYKRHSPKMDTETMLTLQVNEPSLCFFGEICSYKRGSKQNLVLNNLQAFWRSCRPTLQLPWCNGEEKQSWKHSLPRCWPSHSQVPRGTQASDNAPARPALLLRRNARK